MRGNLSCYSEQLCTEIEKLRYSASQTKGRQGLHGLEGVLCL